MELAFGSTESVLGAKQGHGEEQQSEHGSIQVS